MACNSTLILVMLPQEPLKPMIHCPSSSPMMPPKLKSLGLPREPPSKFTLIEPEAGAFLGNNSLCLRLRNWCFENKHVKSGKKLV